MARSGKLRPALDRVQGRNFKLEKQRKQEKAAEKRKRAKAEEAAEDEDHSSDNEDAVINDEDEDTTNVDVEWETEEEDEDNGEDQLRYDLSRLEDSDSDDSEDDSDEVAHQNGGDVNGTAINGSEAHGAEEEDDEEDIPLSDLSSIASEDKGDIIPHQRLTINNTTALNAALKRIALPITTLPFSEHQSITTTEPVSILDIEDDLNRELAFYQQSLNAVKTARTLLKKEGVPFNRPVDYFAEMVKSDEHMGRVKKKLVDVAAGKKAAAEARKQRDLKKFGKAVQVEKQKERDRQKRETLDKINSLKRKRSGADLTNTNEDGLFDVALEDAATTERADKAARRQKGGAAGKPNYKRQKRDEQYGFGGKKRHKKSGDAISSADMRDFSTKRMKSNSFGGGKGSKRPGKSKRAKMR